MEGKPVKHMNRCFVALLACAGWLSAHAARAALTDPGQIQTEAYVNLVQADQSLDAGRLDEALAQYKAARDYYVQLAQDFPGWEPRVIQYRKTYCDNQITDVEHRLSGGLPAELPELPELAPEPAPAAAPPAAAVAATPEPPPAPASERSVEIDYLKSRIASLEAETAEIDTFEAELKTVAAENDKLRQELDEANRKLAEKAQAEQAALDGLRAELAAKEEQIQGLQKDLDAKKPLDQALNDMEAKVNDLRAENERLKKEIKTLDGELDDAEIRADQAELKAKQAEEKAKDAEKDLKKSRADFADAEQDLQKARDRQADAEKELAALQRKPAAEKPAREKHEPKSEPKPEAKAEAAPEPAAIEKAPELPKEEPKAEAKAEPPAASPVKATVPPRDVPRGMAPADYVRQLLQEGDNDGALATVQEARKKAPADMNLLLIEGIALIRLQRYPEAATLLIDLAKNNPRNAEAHATLGAAMMGAGFYEEARETLLMAVKLDKNLPECHYNLAQLYAFVDPIDLKQARRYYKQARDLGIASDKQIEKALK